MDYHLQHELRLFTYEYRVITYCTIYELIFTCELQVTIPRVTTPLAGIVMLIM